MKSILEIDNLLTAAIARNKSSKGGLHSWKTHRPGQKGGYVGDQDVYSRDQVDRFLDDAREELIIIRQELRETAGI